MSISVVEVSSSTVVVPPWMRRRSVRLIAAVVALEVAAVAAYFGVETLRLEGASEQIVTLEGMRGGPGNAYPFHSINSPGIENPETVEAASAELADDELVFGVRVGKHYRAYRTLALSTPDTHIINDMIDGVPVSVTFCNESRCVRVFSDTSRHQPLKISAAGKLIIDETQMVLRVEGVTYYQNSLGAAHVEWASKPPDKEPIPAFPFKTYPVETVTWKAWREQHPDTDVFQGRNTAAVRQFHDAGVDPVF